MKKENLYEIEEFDYTNSAWVMKICQSTFPGSQCQ